MIRFTTAALFAGSLLIAPNISSAHPFLGALPYSKADTSSARSKEDCIRLEKGKSHKRPPKLRGFGKHEHHYIPGRSGDKCVTVFHNLKRGVSSFNNDSGNFEEVPSRQIQRKLFP